MAYYDSRLQHVEAAFDTFLARAQEVCPGLRVRLVVDPDAGKRGGRNCSRAFAYCMCDDRKARLPNSPTSRGRRHRARGEGYIIAVAPKIALADDSRIEALICHELAHAILLHLGHDTHTERDADNCAEFVFDVQIFYDHEDVQTTDASAKHARRPRPTYLDDEDGFTRTA